MPRNVAAVARRGSGGMNLHHLSSTRTRAISFCGSRLITWCMTTAVTPPGSRPLLQSVCTTATATRAVMKVFGHGERGLGGFSVAVKRRGQQGRIKHVLYV
ncbi:hypothetical protein OIU74_024510 [Salix koriyanagi]|uniref:Uncharacterized protein n=1 Tax=Salix koriyanagi TaxID=2511006 RepID=A0A9Q1A8J2_9ROSI|nr:hypothetical protein OIU74_024510 [Salix koriyanagi]